jgi:uncharacterized protein YukJ
MPLERYGVLRARVVGRLPERTADSPHFQIHARAGGADYRIAVNVKSQESPSELLYLADEAFRHPGTEGLAALPEGFTPLAGGPGGGALDYIRGNLFSRADMRALPPSLPGPDNDLSEGLDHYVGKAERDQGAVLYAFGQRWGPEQDKDEVFGFRPGNGIHDIHMNQGNVGRFVADDGVWQDGGLLLEFPDTGQWVAIFLAFQSQAWHTDDATGHRLADEPSLAVRIVAALVNPTGPAPEAESVTLINASAEPVELGGWALVDRLKRPAPLPEGTLAPGATRCVPLPPTLQLGNDGGIITLLDPAGLKVDGVSYTKAQTRREGWTIVF